MWHVVVAIFLGLFISPLLGASELIIQDFFQPILVDDVDIAADSDNMGHTSTIKCGVQCMNTDTCVAFYHSPSNMCFLVRKSTKEPIPERVAKTQIHLWIRKSKLTSDAECSVNEFPITRGRSRYGFIRYRVKWSTAHTTCQGRKGKLAELTTKLEQAFITTSLREIPKVTDYVHVGLKKLPGSKDPGKGWIWYKSKSPFVGVWENNQPNSLNEDIGALAPKSGGMNDVHELDAMHFLCECMLL